MRDRYELLFQCYLSEQMSEAALSSELKADDVFRAWFDRRMAQLRKERACR
jgi:uncharacterized protein YfaT (DUF1175 family)